MSYFQQLLSEPEKIQLDDVRLFYSSREVSVYDHPNEYTAEKQKEWPWERILQCGKSYMAGDIPMEQFLKQSRSSLSKWQKLAWHWCMHHSDRCIVIRTSRYNWEISRRGEDYVEFGLPHHDAGGEKHWVSRQPTSKYLINVD
jgi:hypothetical protein